MNCTVYSEIIKQRQWGVSVYDVKKIYVQVLTADKYAILEIVI